MKTISPPGRRWGIYGIEAIATGMLVAAAGAYTLAVQHPGSPFYALFGNPAMRRAAIGCAMGTSVIAIAYSPWGRRSGAHLNPALTLTFFRLGKVAKADAVWYVVAQVTGAFAGVASVALLARAALSDPHVRWYVTVPGMFGVGVAFAGEFAVTAILMATILATMISLRFRIATPVFAGAIVALAIALESPLSGTGLNPARSLATATFSGTWDGIWVYLTAPFAGMFLAASLFDEDAIPCAKLAHDHGRPCQFLHCAFAAATARIGSHLHHRQLDGGKS